MSIAFDLTTYEGINIFSGNIQGVGLNTKIGDYGQMTVEAEYK